MISQKMFTMLVIMAILSTVITTPALRYYLARTRHRELTSPA
jgi:Kef-type K+ transport system membrane component KefB